MLGALALAGLLQGCSVMKIAYNQAPELIYWHLDGHLDFTDAQTLQVKADLTKLQAWHRQTQLPAYIETLQKLRQQIPFDMDAAAACAVYADVRGKLMAVSSQAEPAVVALVGTLSAGQLVKLERRFAKGNADYREDFLDGSSKARRDKRYKQAVSRAEMLYGSLDPKQLAVIGHRIDISHFSAPVSYGEKLRRQQDALETLRPLAAGQGTPETTQTAIKGLFERSLNSPDPAYRDYMDKLTQNACTSFAELHNSTTPAQRGKAVETLLRYEQNFRTLHLQKS